MIIEVQFLPMTLINIFTYLKLINILTNATVTKLFITIPGHPPELSDYVKLVITNGSSHVFEIELLLKSIL